MNREFCLGLLGAGDVELRVAAHCASLKSRDCSDHRGTVGNQQALLSRRSMEGGNDTPGAEAGGTPALPGKAGELRARWNSELSGLVEVTVRHGHRADWRRPEAGRLVVLQPWEYGHLPGVWAEGAVSTADEVWAPSRFVRDVYVRSGVPAEKVRVVPPGYDPAVYTPDGPHYPLPTEKSVGRRRRRRTRKGGRTIRRTRSS
jgi:hypothetical protein